MQRLQLLEADAQHRPGFIVHGQMQHQTSENQGTSGHFSPHQLLAMKFDRGSAQVTISRFAHAVCESNLNTPISSGKFLLAL